MFKKDDIVVSNRGLEVKVYHMVDRDNFAGVVINEGNTNRKIGYESCIWNPELFKLKYRQKTPLTYY